VTFWDKQPSLYLEVGLLQLATTLQSCATQKSNFPNSLFATLHASLVLNLTFGFVSIERFSKRNVAYFTQYGCAMTSAFLEMLIHVNGRTYRCSKVKHFHHTPWRRLRGEKL
jgi:hypothetical protein